MIERVRIIRRRLIKDDRGWFFKAMTGKEEGLPIHFGEVYLTMGYPGQVKGGHYHPSAQEWFTIIAGKAVLRLMDVESKTQMSITMTLDDQFTVYVPNGVAHEFENIGDTDMIVLAYSDLQYDPSDTIPFKL